MRTDCADWSHLCFCLCFAARRVSWSVFTRSTAACVFPRRAILIFIHERQREREEEKERETCKTKTRQNTIKHHHRQRTAQQRHLTNSHNNTLTPQLERHTEGSTTSKRGERLTFFSITFLLNESMDHNTTQHNTTHHITSHHFTSSSASSPFSFTKINITFKSNFDQ